MDRIPAELKDELQNEVFILRTLTEEVRRNLSRGGQEAARRWQRLEPASAAILERAKQELSVEVCASLRETVAAVQAFHTQLMNA